VLIHPDSTVGDDGADHAHHEQHDDPVHELKHRVSGFVQVKRRSVRARADGLKLRDLEHRMSLAENEDQHQDSGEEDEDADDGS